MNRPNRIFPLAPLRQGVPRYLAIVLREARTQQVERMGNKRKRPSRSRGATIRNVFAHLDIRQVPFFPLVRSQESIDSKEAPTTTREPLTKVGLSVASATC